MGVGQGGLEIAVCVIIGWLAVWNNTRLVDTGTFHPGIYRYVCTSACHKNHTFVFTFTK